MNTIRVEQGYWAGGTVEGMGRHWVDTSYTVTVYTGSEYRDLVLISQQAANVVTKRVKEAEEAFQQARWRVDAAFQIAIDKYVEDARDYASRPWYKKLCTPPVAPHIERNPVSDELTAAKELLNKIDDFARLLIRSVNVPSLFHYADKDGFVDELIDLVNLSRARE